MVPFIESPTSDGGKHAGCVNIAFANHGRRTEKLEEEGRATTTND
jgi:hypothetical protein